MFGHPGPRGLTLFALGAYGFGQGAGHFGEDFVHFFQAHRRVSVSFRGGETGNIDSTFEGIGCFNRNGEVLVLLKLKWKRPQGAQHTILVDDIDLVGYGVSPSMRMVAQARLPVERFSGGAGLRRSASNPSEHPANKPS
jgi:hypothetical protein